MLYDLLSQAKPILFNYDMSRAILDNRKSCTRRIANVEAPATCLDGFEHSFVRDDFAGGIYTGYVCKHCGYGVSFPHSKYPVGTSFIRPKYNTGDVLYVRETWGFDKNEWIYKADYTLNELDRIANITRWLPSIHMPKKAARTFLRVTEVRLEHLQDITENDVEKEGTDNIEKFKVLWNSTVSPASLAKCGWEANPWVWVYVFEKL